MCENLPETGKIWQSINTNFIIFVVDIFLTLFWDDFGIYCRHFEWGLQCIKSFGEGGGLDASLAACKVLSGSPGRDYIFKT